MNSETSAVILAAGKGTRMKSNLPKVLCRVLFKPMVCWVYDAVQAADIKNVCTVVGHGADQVKQVMGDSCEYALQNQQLGTGHAVAMAKDFIAKHGGDVCVLCGDAPFMDRETLLSSLALHQSSGAAVTVISAKLDTPTGYGRIVREGDQLCAIVEEKEADDNTRKIKEVNSGAYWFDSEKLCQVLDKIKSNNAAGEYYLTDAISILRQQGEVCKAYLSANSDVILGANDRRTLMQLNQLANSRVIERLMDEGVEFVSTDGIVLSPDVQVGPDTTILPGTIAVGHVKIGSGCIIGPNSYLTDCQIGDNTIADNAKITSAKVGSGVRLGPFMQIRPGSIIADNAKIGNFTEIKNSTIGYKTSVAHLTYVGDSDVGDRVNFGCGTVTVNYDGVNKYRTTIENDCFIGCNTNLISPVTVHKGAYTAAGSTVTEDVPAGSLYIERGQPIVKDGWADKKLAQKRKK